MKNPDMSKVAFGHACQRYGFHPVGFMGYYRIGHGLEVSIHNAGPRRRDQLAYLLRKHDQEAAKKLLTPTLTGLQSKEVGVLALAPDGQMMALAEARRLERAAGGAA